MGRHRRYSLSEMNTMHSMDDQFKHILIDKMMEQSLPKIITDIVSLWYVLPDCELTFLSLVDATNVTNEHPVRRTEHRLNLKEIDLSRLKKLRKYFWRKPFKFMVHSYLASSRKEELVLIQILNNLQIAVVSDNSALSFSSFIQCCKNNSKIGKLT